MQHDYLIIGAGFFGSVVAERIANELSASVLVIDKRPHIGGNCYSAIDPETNIEYHEYGTHIFHTASKKAWDYINKFTEFNSYHHQVLTMHHNKVYQMPINLETINTFYNMSLRPLEAKLFIEEEIARENITEPRNLEEKAISLIGRPLYEAFIKGYTIKQWGKDPKDLPAKIISRLPVRYNYREDYFVTDRWQGIPLEGYTRVFERLLASPNIRTELNCDYFSQRDQLKPRKKTIYTGPIDRFFDYVYDRLEWRTINLEREVLDMEDYQGTSVMNYADISSPYTRSHEPRHLHPERRYQTERTLVFHESSRMDSERPFYPINTERNNTIYQQYQKLMEQEKQVIIGGRLGNYAYYDMDKTILAALKCFEEQIAR